MSTIQHAIWLYQRFSLSYRNVHELLQKRGNEVSHDTLREWNIKFSPLVAEELCHRKPRWDFRWHMDEVCMTGSSVRHCFWRAVDEHGIVLDVLLQRRNTEATRTFLARLLSEFHVTETICTVKLASYGAAIPALEAVEHQRVISTTRRNNLTVQSHRPTRQQERDQLSFRKIKRTQEFLIPHARISGQASSSALLCPRHQFSAPCQNHGSRPHQKKQPTPGISDVARGRRRGGLTTRPPLPSICQQHN